MGSNFSSAFKTRAAILSTICGHGEVDKTYCGVNVGVSEPGRNSLSALLIRRVGISSCSKVKAFPAEKQSAKKQVKTPQSYLAAPTVNWRNTKRTTEQD
jgi:hypothetical protein